MNDEYLNVSALVEDAYEEIIGSSAAAATNTQHNPNLIKMLKEIELHYENVVLELDFQPNDIMIETSRKFYKKQKSEMAEAKHAEKEVSLGKSNVEDIGGGGKRQGKEGRGKKRFKFNGFFVYLFVSGEKNE